MGAVEMEMEGPRTLARALPSYTQSHAPASAARANTQSHATAHTRGAVAARARYRYGASASILCASTASHLSPFASSFSLS